MTTNEITQRNDDSIEVMPPSRPYQNAALANLDAQVEAMAKAHHLAKVICGSSMGGRLRGKPDDAAVAILYGAEVGLKAHQAVHKVVVVHGMPTLEARTMVGLLKAKGYKVRTVAQSDESVTVQGVDLDGEVYESTWTIDRAIRAGYVPTKDERTGKYKLNANGKLIGNEKYLTDPQTMLKAKAQAEVCREIAPDVLLGISYTSEDLESEQWDGTVSVTPPARASKPVTVDEILAEEVPVPESAPATAADDVEPAFESEPSPSEPEPDDLAAVADAVNAPDLDQAIDAAEDAAEKPPAKKAPAKKAAPREVSKLRPGLEKRLFALLGDAGLADDKNRDGRIAVYRSVLERDDITSTNDLTDVEVTKVGDQLYRWQSAGALDDEVGEILLDAARDAEDTAQASAAAPTSEGSE